ncbi:MULTISPECIES: purine-nucleoside phosphorylase [Paenibacillus]|uniref:Purine nucleoside phosphorylase DeoD-type n=3 Tax=Paenibacillus TaxID=44249 RepID=A0AAJ2N737_9BACL|nr:MULTISPECIES: purine-nucleoside phosphorylase [Paenibacillus]MDT8979245.1 purine-nucleoside phosphorylase [Paenibacillus sp. chi10]TQR41737.1 purine-nucleoside phosphorylase [Paenibacillus sp. SDF0028]GAV16035.1 purine nucleoside phosphorylase deoD-type [Paenibacillus sp. NAIST15-1]SYX81709.1 purine nucleoside phosphorylase [Paenibacillus alvei]
MSVHIEAKKGEIAPVALMPGDPLRAKYIAETFLENAKCHNQVRGMLGFTGTYKGKPVSVQGSGMGVPSFAIYATELIQDYDVKTIIRIGTCGAIQHDVKLRDVLIAQAVCTDSSLNTNRFPGYAFAPIGNFDLIKTAYDIGMEKKLNLRVGNILCSDIFYTEDNDKETMLKLGAYGVLAVEMETAALYTLAAKHQINGLAMFTVSDHILTGEATTSEERQLTFNDMIEVALETAIRQG